MASDSKLMKKPKIKILPFRETDRMYTELMEDYFNWEWDRLKGDNKFMALYTSAIAANMVGNTRRHTAIMKRLRAYLRKNNYYD